MRSRLAAFFSAVVFLSLAGVAAAQDFDEAGEAAMLNRINALRAEQQLAPLARMPALDAVARAHSTEMASLGELAHVSQRTGTPEDRVRGAGVGASTIAENVAMHRDAAQAQDALLASPAHRGNMLSADVTHAGLGVVRTAQGVYVTQVFAGVPPQAPVAAAPAEPAAEEPASDGSIFALIPPFVEQILAAPDSAGEAATSAPAAPSPVASPAAPSTSRPPSDGAPESTPSAAPAPAAPSTEQPATSAATAATLRQLVGLAQSLLGSSAQQ